MLAQEISSGHRYQAADPQDGKLIVVRVIARSASSQDRWACLRDDGRRVILSTAVFIRPVPGGVS